MRRHLTCNTAHGPRIPARLASENTATPASLIASGAAVCWSGVGVVLLDGYLCFRFVVHVLAELGDCDLDGQEVARRDHLDDDLLRHLSDAASPRIGSLPLGRDTLSL